MLQVLHPKVVGGSGQHLIYQCSSFPCLGQVHRIAEQTEKGKAILHLFQKCIFVLVNFQINYGLVLRLHGILVSLIWYTLKLGKPKQIYNVKKKNVGQIEC